MPLVPVIREPELPYLIVEITFSEFKVVEYRCKYEMQGYVSAGEAWFINHAESHNGWLTFDDAYQNFHAIPVASILRLRCMLVSE